MPEIFSVIASWITSELWRFATKHLRRCLRRTTRWIHAADAPDASASQIIAVRDGLDSLPIKDEGRILLERSMGEHFSLEDCIDCFSLSKSVEATVISALSPPETTVGRTVVRDALENALRECAKFDAARVNVNALAHLFRSVFRHSVLSNVELRLAAGGDGQQNSAAVIQSVAMGFSVLWSPRVRPWLEANVKADWEQPRVCRAFAAYLADVTTLPADTARLISDRAAMQARREFDDCQELGVEDGEFLVQITTRGFLDGALTALEDQLAARHAGWRN